MPKILDLYHKVQPKKIKIGSLMGKIEKNIFLVSSPDGWVPVVDCIEKQKESMFEFIFVSGTKIMVSHDHLFQKSDNSWQYARYLNIGDGIISTTGIDTIVSIISTTKKTKVYDLSVDHTNHRYYTNNLCSHNSGKSLFLQNLACNWVLKASDEFNCVCSAISPWSDEYVYGERRLGSGVAAARSLVSHCFPAAG